MAAVKESADAAVAAGGSSNDSSAVADAAFTTDWVGVTESTSNDNEDITTCQKIGVAGGFLFCRSPLLIQIMR